MSWFSPKIEYKGSGIAEFQNPEIAIFGHVKIQFMESGDHTIEMEAEKYDSDSSGLTFRDLIRTLSSNKCIRLNVSTKNGIFSAEGIINYDYEEEIVAHQGVRISLKFHPLRSFFDMNNAKTAKYWILPLLNFVSNYSLKPPELVTHPLRIDGKNRLIKFSFNDALAFIEPLSDYTERERILREGNIQNSLTAVMVGEIGGNSIEYDNLKNWFPFDFLGLLGIATGSEVSAQCIEFRDPQGELVRRMHLKFKKPCYFKGHVSIDEFYNVGIGQLLNSFQSSQVYNECSDESYFTAVLENLIRGGLGNLTSEDKLGHIFRGLDCLCEKYKLKTKDLREDLDSELKEEVEKAVKCAIQSAEMDLIKLEVIAKSKGEDQVKIIKKILNKMNQSDPYHDNAYGRAVIDLMHKFYLCDTEIVEAHYKKNPRWDRKKWVQVLPYYRGKTMHSGYFKFHENKHYQDDVPRIHRHLNDVLLRIVLKMVGYNGTYHPTVKQEVTTDRSDWVNCDTSASELGYKAMSPQDTLDAMCLLIEGLNSGAFKVVTYKENDKKEDINSKPTGRTTRTLEIEFFIINDSDMKEPKPTYKTINPKDALDAMDKLIKEIKSGVFKVVEHTETTDCGILTMPVVEAKTIAKSSIQEIRTLKITASNNVAE